MKQKLLLLSIHPQYADAIFDGIKTVELRKLRPKVSSGDIVLVYVTSPRKVLAGAFEVDNIIEDEPRSLWKKVEDTAAIDKDHFDAYFSKALNAIGIGIRKAWRFKDEIPLQKLQENIPGFTPPQSYRYLTSEQIETTGVACPL